MVEKGNRHPEKTNIKWSPGQALSERVLGHYLKTYEFSEESQANLFTLNSLLETNSAVVYANHTKIADIPLSVSLVKDRLPNAQRYLGPVSIKNFDVRRGHLKAFGLRSLSLLNIQLLPVVSVTDTVDYGEDKRRMIDDLKMETQKALTTPGAVVGISPEGTRNGENGTLQRANRSIGYLEPYEDIFYLPLDMIHPQFSDKPQIIVGEPQLLPDIIPESIELPQEYKPKAQAIADIHMYRLATLMPPHLQGVYAPNPKSTDRLP